MKAHRLLIVAHPDDETIFFGGLVLALRSLPWRLICVTDGNADGRGAERHQELLAAAKALGIRDMEHWDFPDRFEQRIDLVRLADRLSTHATPKEIFTHGPFGEYGHAHHQDVSAAAFQAFPKAKIWSPAWNCKPEKVLRLSPAHFRKKGKILEEIYGKETMRFLPILPHQGVETFCRFQAEEVKNLTAYLRREKSDLSKLKAYAWLAPQLPLLRDRIEKRLF